MAAPVVSPVRGCGPDSGERGPSAGKLMSLTSCLRVIQDRSRWAQPRDSARPCFGQRLLSGVNRAYGPKEFFIQASLKASTRAPGFIAPWTSLAYLVRM